MEFFFLQRKTFILKENYNNLEEERKNMINVLSIDYDYFQKVTKRDILHYPDGIDLEPHISSIVWVSKYEIYKDLDNITNNHERLSLVSEIVSENKSAKKMVSYTHRDIYDFIIRNTLPEDEISIYNLDMHHDVFNSNDELDCGNWISFLKKVRKSTIIYWYANPISASVYGIEEYSEYLHADDISELANNKYDLIFLCKSPNWVPPHLYGEYEELRSLMEK